MDIDQFSQMQFNKAQSKCANEALSALQGFTDEDIKNFIHDVFSEANDEGIPLAKAVEQQVHKLKDILGNRLYRLNKAYGLLFSPKTGWFNLIKDGKLTLNDILSKNSLKNRSGNVEVSQQATTVRLRQKFLGQLSTKAQDILMSGEHDKAIADYLVNGKIPKI